MRSSRLVVAVVGSACAAVVIACGSGNAGTGSLISGQDAAAEGGNPADCPLAIPVQGTPCSTPSLGCRYGAGCPTFATCSNGTWQVAASGCQEPEDQCASRGGTCSFSFACDPGQERAAGDTESALCGVSSGPGAKRICCVAKDGGADAADAADGD